jgi:PCO_ADO
MHVAEVEGAFSIGIFLFKKGSHLRLHDHPGMSVFTRQAALCMYMCRIVQLGIDSCYQVCRLALPWWQACGCLVHLRLHGVWRAGRLRARHKCSATLLPLVTD